MTEPPICPDCGDADDVVLTSPTTAICHFTGCGEFTVDKGHGTTPASAQILD